MTIGIGLERLLEAGLIVADPPHDITAPGQRVRYTVDDARVTETVMRPDQMLGEFRGLGWSDTPRGALRE
jgi:hypothetical protein